MYDPLFRRVINLDFTLDRFDISFYIVVIYHDMLRCISLYITTIYHDYDEISYHDRSLQYIMTKFM